MKRRQELRHEFVEFVPADLQEGVLYVSIPYATASHNCCCGCGQRVVTPITPTDWSLIFDGESVSLDPSIGNWSFACQSHYWIRNGKIHWATKWSKERVELGRSWDEERKERHYDKITSFEKPSNKAETKTWSSRVLKRFTK